MFHFNKQKTKLKFKKDLKCQCFKFSFFQNIFVLFWKKDKYCIKNHVVSALNLCNYLLALAVSLRKYHLTMNLFIRYFLIFYNRLEPSGLKTYHELRVSVEGGVSNHPRTMAAILFHCGNKLFTVLFVF